MQSPVIENKTKTHPKKTSKKAVKAHNPLRIKSCKKEKQHQDFCVSFTQGPSPPCACCANSVTLTQEWSCYIRLNSMCETQVPSSSPGGFYKKPVHTL